MTARAAIGALLLLAAVARFYAATYSGVVYTGDGDFRPTLPAGYFDGGPAPASVAELFTDRWTLPSYPRGPSQYLTILPMAFLAPYDRATLVLQAIGAAFIFFAAFLMWRILAAVSGWRGAWVPVCASTLAFTPLLDAYTGRELELVILLSWCLATLAMVRGHSARAGALFAYVALYKYIPVLVLPYLAVRRRWRAVAAFSVTALLIIAAAHAAFGIDRFTNNRLGAIARSRVTLDPVAFCAPISIIDTLEANPDGSMRGDLCRLQGWTGLPAVPLYLLIVVVTAVGIAYGFIRAGGFGSRPDDQWRLLVEVGVLLSISTTFFYAQYYHLGLLILPLNILLVRLLIRGAKAALAFWAVSYFLLGMFVVPAFVWDRWFGIAIWNIYDNSPARLAGELILLALLLSEYARPLPQPSEGHQASSLLALNG